MWYFAKTAAPNMYFTEHARDNFPTLEIKFDSKCTGKF